MLQCGKSLLYVILLGCIGCSLDTFDKIEHTYFVRHFIFNGSGDTILVSFAKEADQHQLYSDSIVGEELSILCENTSPNCFVGTNEINELSDSFVLFTRDSSGNFSYICTEYLFMFDTVTYSFELPFNESVDSELLYADTFVVTDSLLASCRQ